MKLKTNTSVLVLYVCYCRIARIAVYWRLVHVCRSGDKNERDTINNTKKKYVWTYDLIVFSTRAESRTEQNARNTSKSSAAQQRARNDANDDGLFATKRQHFPIVVHALEEQSTMCEYDDDDPSFGKTLGALFNRIFFIVNDTRNKKIKMLSSGDKSNENNAKKRLVAFW